jgi:hypothetical protein
VRALLEKDASKPMDVRDYHEDNGAAKTPPALDHVGLVESVVRACNAVMTMRERLAPLPPATIDDALKAIADLEQLAMRFDDPQMVDELNELLGEARRLTREAFRKPEAQAFIRSALEVQLAADEALPDLSPQPTREGAVATGEGQGTLVAWLLWLIYVTLILSIGVTAVYLSSYVPKPAFGSRADYLALAAAALGSAAAGTVAAAIGFWRIESAAQKV